MLTQAIEICVPIKRPAQHAYRIKLAFALSNLGENEDASSLIAQSDNQVISMPPKHLGMLCGMAKNLQVMGNTKEDRMVLIQAEKSIEDLDPKLRGDLAEKPNDAKEFVRQSIEKDSPK